MKTFLRFMSLTTATQIFLAVNQIVLLPLQLRVWGRDATAQWFVVIAVANLASVADLGLRNASHDHLLSSVQTGDEDAAGAFRRTWALARALFIGLTTALIAGQAVLTMRAGQPLAPWIFAVTLSFALETVVIVRGIWLDTLGHFNRVEAVYLAFVAARVGLSFAALLIFRAPPEAIAWIMLGCALAATAGQAWLLRRPQSLAFLAPGFRELRWRALGVVRFVVTEPAVNWVRLSLPVVVLAPIASPMFVATYVAMRALFSMARAVINQLARYASVGYVLSVETDQAAAERLAIRYILMSTVVGVGVSSAIIADHGRIVGVWLNGADAFTVGAIALSFAVGAAAYGYQVINGVLIRSGDVVGVAARQYAFLIGAVIAAVVARVFASPVLYLALLAGEELLVAGLFISALGPAVRRVCVTAFAVAVCLLVPLWLAANFDVGGIFDAMRPGPLLASLTVAGAVSLMMIVQGFAIDRFGRISFRPHRMLATSAAPER
jgi:hypothetical protein